MKFEAICPHCEEAFTFEVKVEKPDPARRKGPKPFDYGPEFDRLVLEAIERHRLSLSKVGELLENRGIATPTGLRRWYPASVKRLYEGALVRRAEAEAEAGIKPIIETPN
jgi:hypothetical protein